jgi:hypothetical protein
VLPAVPGVVGLDEFGFVLGVVLPLVVDEHGGSPLGDVVPGVVP